MSMSGGLLVSTTVSLGITLLSSAVLALLVDREKLSWDTVGYWVMAVLLVSSFAGSATACRTIKRRKGIVSLASGAAYYAVLLGITALFFGGQYEAVGVTALLILSGSISAALISTTKRTRKKGKNRRIHG